VTSKRGISTFALAGLVLVAAGALLLAGCMSLDIAGAVGKQIAPKPAPAPQGEPAPAPEPQPAPDNSQARSGGGSAMAYQYQFNAMYSGFWAMGWFGYKDGNYKAGQGTIWKFTGTGRGSDKPVTFERALLKVGTDATQWWRFRVESGKDIIVYEFLIGSDSVVKKVRFKDPDSGTVQEFVPSQDNSMPSQAPANMPKSRADMAKYKVDRQNVKVQAGSFDTDHYLYTDTTAQGSVESWVNDTVPGYMVKTVYTNKKNNQTSNGELIQIESGVTTTLGSF
jgi:hypothetical protein